MKTSDRMMHVGAEPRPGGGVHFRVWAPDRSAVEVVLEEGGGAPLQAEGDGYFSGLVPEAGPGTRYRFRLDGEGPFPDPASRFQPEGPHGPSQVVDPGAFAWSDGEWRGVGREGQVIYELHLGTFTPEGTWAAAMRELPALAELGITLVEVMPVAEFPGRFGWGYDGVNLFAPTRLYGEPDDFRRYVDRAHQLGLGVILDVVYNHLGPDGNYLRQYARRYFDDQLATDWGEPPNFQSDDAGPVRDFFVANAAYWIREYHLDGLRLDATQNIYDREGPGHVVAELTAAARAAAGDRSIFVVSENERQQAVQVRSREVGGHGLDAIWNDDFHHAAMVAATGRAEAYYSDFRGTAQELISALRWGFLFQGQRSRWQSAPRGTPALDLPGAAFVTFLQNHDQVSNSVGGERLHRLTTPGRYRALTALSLLAPGTPMLFQGQEFAASTPFLYFADHQPELAAAVYAGRRGFLGQFPSLTAEEMQAQVPDPADPETFRRSRLDLGERERHAQAYALHRDLLRLRREDSVFRAQRVDRMHGAVLGAEAFLLRFLGGDGQDRLLLVNLGADLELSVVAEPLLAPPAGARWSLLWSSEEVRYGGGGTATPHSDRGWLLTGHATLVLTTVPEDADA